MWGRNGGREGGEVEVGGWGRGLWVGGGGVGGLGGDKGALNS